MAKSQKKPSLLKKGELVSIIASASNVDAGKIESAKKIISSWGLEVRIAENIYSQGCYFAGQDNIRLKILQDQLDDPEVKTIISARGGYGTTRIIDKIDLTAFQQNPKWFIGFSDMTVLHAKIQQAHQSSIHGPMAVHFPNPSYVESVADLEKFLFTGSLTQKFKASPENRSGSCHSKITGGNLNLLCNSLGTRTELNSDGKILFIEEVDEYTYNIDRMIVQLKRAGKLQNIAGLIVGQFTDIKDSKVPFGKSFKEIITGHISEYDFPVGFDIPAGHGKPNAPIVFGKMCQLSVDKNNTSLDF